MTPKKTGTYNLGAVLKETGLGADRLRAWERRYGIPMPQRTAGGHRAYSRRDIDLIKWLMARHSEGLSISRATEHLKELIQSGNDPLERAGMTAAVDAARQAGSRNIDQLRDQWMAACLAYDEATAEQILNQAFALYSVEVVIAELVQHGLRQVGELWQYGKASVQQEHFVSNLAARRLDALIAAAPLPNRWQTAVLACPEAEQHTLPLLQLNVSLRRRGLKVVFLGADVPATHLEETAQAVQPALVAMSAQQLATAVTLKHTAARLTEQGIQTAHGGRVFNLLPELSEQIAGEYLGAELETAADKIEELLQNPGRIHPARKVHQDPQLQPFLEAQSQIELNVAKHLETKYPVAGFIATENHLFSAALAAALEFGNVEYMAADSGWAGYLLGMHGETAVMGRDYLLTYAETIRRTLGSPAAHISDWLNTYAAGI